MNVLKPFDLGITSNEDAIRDLEDLPVVEPIDLGDIVAGDGFEVVRSDYDAVNVVVQGYGFERLRETNRIVFTEKRVSYLSLYSMNLEGLSGKIGRLTGLKELYLNKNRLSVLPVWMRNLVNLEHLNLSFNQLSVLPEEFYGLPNLEELWVNGNPLSDYSVVDKLEAKGVEVYT